MDQLIKTAFRQAPNGRLVDNMGFSSHLTIALPRRGAAEGNGERKIGDESRRA